MRAVDFSLFPRISDWEFWSSVLNVIKIAAGILPFMLLKKLIQVRHSKVKVVLLLLLCEILMWLPCYVGDATNLPMMFLAFTAAILFGCEGTLQQKLAAAVLTAGPAFSVNVLTDNYFLVFDGMRSVPLPGYWEIRLGYWAVMCLLARKLLPGRRYDLPGKFWNLLILLSVPVLGMLGALVVFSSLEVENLWLDVSVSLLCMLYWTGMILTVHVLGRQQELERSEHFYQMRQQYYNAMEQQQKEVRRLRHDMKNHLTALSGLSGQEREAYLAKIQDAPAFSPGRTYCENKTANVVLCAKADQAAARLPADQRHISLSARVEKGLFAVKVSNTYLFLERGIDGRLSTLKKDRKNHGYGLASVEEIVERYGGRLEYEAKEKEFELFFYLPV